MRHLERFLAGIPIFIVLLAVGALLIYVVLYHPVLVLIAVTIGIIYYLGKKYESY